MISCIFFFLSLLLSHLMVGVIAYNYAFMQCGIRHMGFSAPAWVAFLYSIPFLFLIILCLALSIWFRKKENK